MTAIAEQSEFYLHPYICEGCFTEVPLTEHQYLKARDSRKRFLCERCLERKLSKRQALHRALPPTATGRGGE